MKVILLQDVKKLGKKGDTVKVADGYGQNFLIKNKLAVLETDTSRKIVENEKEKAHQVDLENQAKAKELAKRIEDIKIDKRKFIDGHPIGGLGYTKLKVDLYKGIIATINVHLKEQ